MNDFIHSMAFPPEHPLSMRASFELQLNTRRTRRPAHRDSASSPNVSSAKSVNKTFPVRHLAMVKVNIHGQSMDVLGYTRDLHGYAINPIKQFSSGADAYWKGVEDVSISMANARLVSFPPRSVFVGLFVLRSLFAEGLRTRSP